jgi:hypothetical protein
VTLASPIFILELKRWFLGGRSHTSATPIIHRSAACPVTPPHITLASLTKATLSSSRSTVVHQEAPVLGESAWEASEEWSMQEVPTKAREASTMQAQEVLMP